MEKCDQFDEGYCKLGGDDCIGVENCGFIKWEPENRLIPRNVFDCFLDKSGNIFDALNDLYKSEINFSISCFWDNGFDVKLGDSINGFKVEENFDSLYDAMQWLFNMTIKHYPNSSFSENYGIPRRP